MHLNEIYYNDYAYSLRLCVKGCGFAQKLEDGKISEPYQMS